MFFKKAAYKNVTAFTVILAIIMGNRIFNYMHWLSIQTICLFGANETLTVGAGCHFNSVACIGIILLSLQNYILLRFNFAIILLIFDGIAMSNHFL